MCQITKADITLRPASYWKDVVGVDNDWTNFELNDAQWERRDEYTADCAWFIVTEELVDRLAEKFKGKKVVELGCGSGFLMKHLRDRGIDIVGYDIYDGYSFKTIHVDDIIEEDYTKADLSGFDIILMTWPPMSNSANIVARQRMHKGQQLYLEGDRNGCTGNSAFSYAVGDMEHDTVTSAWLNEVQPRWDGIHDCWTVVTK